MNINELNWKEYEKERKSKEFWHNVELAIENVLLLFFVGAIAMAMLWLGCWLDFIVNG